MTRTIRAETQHRRNRHLMVAATAAAAAWTLRRRRLLALPLVGLAAREANQFWSGETAPTLPGAAAPEHIESTIVDGIRMRWEAHGPTDGQPVILVHGIPTHPRLWRYVVSQLADAGLRCLAWEMVGYGWSMPAGLDRDISVARQAQYLRAWLRHLGMERALFVAHDLGGGVVQRLITAEPELCAGLVLTDCIAYDNWPVPPVKAMQIINDRLARVPAALLKPMFMTGVGKLGHNNAARGHESAHLHWQPYAGPLGRRALVHQLRSLDARDTLEIAHRLPELKVPARVVWADGDPLGMAAGEQLARDLDAPLTRIRGGRHFTPEDHPELIAEAVQSLLQDQNVSARRRTV